MTKKLVESSKKTFTPRYSDEDIARLKESERRREIDAAYSTLIGQANLPLRHSDFPACDSQRPEWTAFYDHCCTLHAGYMLGLIGTRGTGKTQLAVALIKQYCHTHYTAGESKGPLYVSAMDIFLSVREAMRLDLSDKQIIENYIRRPLLVIDECQERGETAFEDRILTYVLDKRYGSCRSTILISNQNQPDFERAIGTSVISRMMETGGIKVFNWTSFRNKQGEANAGK